LSNEKTETEIEPHRHIDSIVSYVSMWL